MCGIFAAIGPDVPASSIEDVFMVLDHRGPDGRGLYMDKDVRLTVAHTRLAVIDLITGDQPMESSTGNLVLACNGEIYDFERIKGSLEAKGHQFKTKSDSEVIIHLYEEFGLGCFEHLRGEFAFLLYDRTRKLMIAARDRFGIKPLYFSRRSDGFVFASEMKAIFASGLVDARLDAAALDPLAEEEGDRGRFPFEGIDHVPPASYLVVNLETLESKLSRYWSAAIPAGTAEPVPEPSSEAFEQSAGLVLRQVEDAVRLRLRADVPVGLYLSGGIDSAFVGALMQRNLDAPLHSFSISFPGSQRNEQEFARQAADLLGTIHHELAVTKEMLWEHLEDCVWFSELPFVSLAPVGKFLLSEEARKHVTVVLTGEGADEVFLGYRRFFQNAIRDTRSAASTNASSRLRRLKVAGTPMGRMLSLLIFHKRHRKTIAAARRKKAGTSRADKPIINAVQEARIAAMPLDILCFLGDREEMAHSLEARLPFLDHHLYDTAKDIPVDFKIRAGVEKAVLREAAKDILPDELRLRRKSGFMLTSEAVDLFGADRKMLMKLRSYLSKEAFERSQIFSYRAYRALALLGRLPASKRLPSLRRLRRDSNKVIMYMIQVHMLHEMFIAEPRWKLSRCKSGQGLGSSPSLEVA